MIGLATYYLLLGIVSSSLLFVIFRLFGKYKVNTFQAIVFNYAVATTLTILFIDANHDIDQIPNSPWFKYALVLGIIFISLFYIMARSAQTAGITITTIANKMAFIGPVLFSIYYFKDQLSILQYIGISLAVMAVFLSSYTNQKISFSIKNLFPLILFLGGGLLDTILGFAQKQYVPEHDTLLFTGSIFATAGTLGMILLPFNLRKYKFEFKNILAGIVLGVPNFFSIYFFLKAISTNVFLNSQIFPLSNMGIITLNGFLGILLFKEKLSLIHFAGFIIALLSIYLITFY